MSTCVLEEPSSETVLRDSLGGQHYYEIHAPVATMLWPETAASRARRNEKKGTKRKPKDCSRAAEKGRRMRIS